MKTSVERAYDQFVALFVDDASFAASILAWLAGGFICLHNFHMPAQAEAVVLAIGLGLLLAENVDRTAREIARP